MADRLLTPALWALSLVFGAVFCLFPYINGTNFLMSDEIQAYAMNLEHGPVQAVHVYWVEWIGRTSAMGWLQAQFSLGQLAGLRPWEGAVAARWTSFLMAAVCFLVGLRALIPKLPWAVSFTITLAGLVGAMTLTGFQTFREYYALDWSIYLGTFFFFCLSVGSWQQLYRDSTSASGIAWCAVAFALFLNAREASLVGGGLILTATTWDLRRTAPAETERSMSWLALNSAMSPIRPAPPRTRSRLLGVILGFRHGFSREHALILLWLVYLASAMLQVFSPSVAFRARVWPAKETFLDSILIGFPATIPFFVDLVNPRHGFFLLIFVMSITATALFSPASARLRSIVPYLMPMVATLAMMFAMAVLSVRTGIHGTAAAAATSQAWALPTLGIQQMPIRQSFLTYLMAMISLTSIGALVGYSERVRRLGRKNLLAVLLGAATLTLLSVYSHKTFHSAWHFARETDMYEVNLVRSAQIAAGPSEDGRIYVEEFTRGHELSAYYEASFRVRGAQLYGKLDYYLVPCTLGPKPTVCNGYGHPVRQRSIAADGQELRALWQNALGVSVDLPPLVTGAGLIARLTGARPADLVATEAASAGEHFISTRPIRRSNQSAVRVEVQIAHTDSPALMLQAISGDNAGTQTFDMRAIQSLGTGEVGNGRVRDPLIIRNPDGTTTISALFALFRPADDVEVRLFTLADTGESTVHQGDATRRLVIRRTKIRLVDTGTVK